MKIPNSREHNDLRDERSMTSMIDVVFLLLIFFVCASLGQMGEVLVGAEMSAGAVDSLEDAPPPEDRPDEVWVSIRRGEAGTTVQVGEEGEQYHQRDGDRTFRESADYSGLVQQLRGLADASAEIPVILDVEPNVPMGDVLAVYTAVKTAAFQNVNFATSPAEQPAP